MRRIGRLRSEASPSNVASIGWLPTTPIISREPVPALPKSSVSRGAQQRAEAGAMHAPAARRRGGRSRRRAAGRPRRCAARPRLRAGRGSRRRRGSAARTGRRDARSTCRRAAARGRAAGRRGGLREAAIWRFGHRADSQTAAARNMRPRRCRRAPTLTGRGAATNGRRHPKPQDFAVAKPELGAKRQCQACAAKFFDLNRDPDRLPEMRHGVPGRDDARRARHRQGRGERGRTGGRRRRRDGVARRGRGRRGEGRRSRRRRHRRRGRRDRPTTPSSRRRRRTRTTSAR